MRYLLSAVMVPALFPAISSAVVTLRPEDVAFPVPGQVVSVDVFAVPQDAHAGR